MGLAGNAPGRQRWCPAAHREWHMAGMEKPRGGDFQAREDLVLKYSSGKPFQNGETRSALPRFQQVHPQSSPDNHKVGKRRKWPTRALEGPPGKRWAETSSLASGSGSLQKTRAASADSVITGDVDRHASKEGSDWNAESHPVSIFKTHGRILFPGSPPTHLPPSLITGKQVLASLASQLEIFRVYLKESVFLNI